MEKSSSSNRERALKIMEQIEEIKKLDQEMAESTENIRVARIRRLIGEETRLRRINNKKAKKYTQEALAYDIGMQPQNLSRSMASGKISDKTCKKIAKIHPRYREQWLLGYDDEMTETEKGIADLKEEFSAENNLIEAFRLLTIVSGFEIEWAEFGGEMFDTVATLKKDGKSISFSHKELGDFLHEICDYMEFRLIHKMKSTPM
ncbi:MAG: hypothetical protein IKQ49_00095 [Eubacterium sp.]|nr:hypothetical protein [Eubacterium sp.]